MSHCHTTADITADTEPGDCSEASAAVLQYICQVSPFMIRDSGCCQSYRLGTHTIFCIPLERTEDLSLRAGALYSR